MLREQDICQNLLNILDILLEDLDYLLNDLSEKAGHSPITQTIKKLCSLDFYDFFLPTNTVQYSEAHKEAFFLRQKHWIIGLLWTLKMQTKIFRKSEYPYNHAYFRIWEPFGKIINSELELWNGCLDFIDTYNYSLLSDQKTAIDGIFQTTYEKMLGNAKSINLIITKQEILKAQLEEIQQLKRGENPYSPTEPDERNLHNLINLAINIKKRGIKDSNAIKKAKTKFINFYWNPYIDAQKEWYTVCESTKDLKMTCIKDNKLKIIIGARQMTTLFPLASGFLKAKRIKKTLSIGSL